MVKRKSSPGKAPSPAAKAKAKAYARDRESLRSGGFDETQAFVQKYFINPQKKKKD